MQDGSGNGTQYLNGDIVVSAQEGRLTAGPKHQRARHLDDTRAARLEDGLQPVDDLGLGGLPEAVPMSTPS